MMMSAIMLDDLLYGRTTLRSDDHLVTTGISVALHPEVYAPFMELRNKAASAGIDLRIASGQRDFARQLMIWNRKAAGDIPVLDDGGKQINIQALAPRDRVMAILRWSSLPGASRHHWGTDVDVFDAAVMPEGYKVQLTTEEAYGLFGHLHRWLDQQISSGDACGFFRPYVTDRGGVAPEPWHLSYAPLARHFQQAFSVTALASQLATSDIALRDDILANLEYIHRCYIDVPAAAYPAQA